MSPKTPAKKTTKKRSTKKTSKKPSKKQATKATPSAKRSIEAERMIRIRGAKEHNLKSVDIDIPRDQLV
ncbi:MAG TPA: hypothetical protein DF699_04200, partial [Phycisphaerales bacterium]|nr:hypothetical protein [Phycisphaerales bacterium]